MKTGISIIIIGITMFSIGLVLFYSIELGQTDPGLRVIKNVGTFVGLSGMGVSLAGVLLHLINRGEAPITESFDV